MACGIVVCLLRLTLTAAAQQDEAPSTTANATQAIAQRKAITLEDALARARKNNTTFLAADTEAKIAREDRVQARDALLPQVSYNNGFLYTQGTGTNPVRFIANNAVHEYISQGNVHQTFDAAAFSGYRKAAAAAAAAKARAEIASRGLVVTVVQGYFAALAAKNKLEVAQKAAAEGEDFFQLTQNLERGGEVAHSDVIKAELQAQDRRRLLQEAKLAELNARLDLAILIFPDFDDNFDLVDDLRTKALLPTLAEVEAQAARDNPDIRAALETLKESGHDVAGARAGYLPSLSVDYFYGIDAAQFAVNGTLVDGQRIRNLGSSAVATLNIPIWNWGSTQSRVKQAEQRRTQAQKELSFAQRKLLAEIRSLYSEAETSLSELAGLERSATLAGDSLRLTTMRYRGGEATVLEVADAQNSFVQANGNYQDGAVRYRVALANLQTLTGVLTTP